MKNALLTGGLALTLALAACSGNTPPAAVAPVVPQASAPAPTPAPAQLNGVARYFGEPFANATVKAYLVGRSEVLATASTQSDGKFQLALPEALPAGALVKLVAIGNGRTVASLARLPERRLMQAQEKAQEKAPLEYLIDEERSMVLLLLGPRLEALGQLALGTEGTVALSVTQAAFNAFKDALGAVSDAKAVSRDAFEKTAPNGFSDDGHFALRSDLVAALAQSVPAGLAKVLVQQADQLAVLIRAEVAAGKTPPDSALTAQLPIGGSQVASPVFSQSGGGSSSGNKQPSAEGTLEIQDGGYAAPSASPSISLDDPN